MRPLFSLFVVLLVFAGAPACARDGWKVYANKALSFSVEGPGDPKVSTISQGFPNFVPGTTTVAYNEGLFERQVVIFEPGPEPKPWPIELAIADKVRSGAQMISSETITLDGIPVRALHYRKSYPDGLQTEAWLLVAVKNGRLYRVSGIEPRGGKGGAERFVRSFRFLA